MSRSESAERRFRVFCDACNYHDQQHYPNSLVARAQAKRHDERVHDGTETADVEAVTNPDNPEIVTDGGQEIDEDDRVDPENLPEGYTPAYVHVRGQGPVLVASYNVLSSGWISVIGWRRSRSKLPPRQVQAVSDVRTEYHGEPDDLGYKSKRIVDEDEREAARADHPRTVDGLPMDDVDRGEAVVPDGGGGDA
ncbi:hypothetical protein [Halorientalis halophila]|uniref:hypothetical protein n=1 Tax=Halorientalis halophila TaxID=3108499 RepID=UPI003008A534